MPSSPIKPSRQNHAIETNQVPETNQAIETKLAIEIDQAVEAHQAVEGEAPDVETVVSGITREVCTVTDWGLGEVRLACLTEVPSAARAEPGVCMIKIRRAHLY